VPTASVLLDRLHGAGLTDVTAVEPVEGGMAALAGITSRRGGPPLFVKSLADVPADGVFAAEAEGLEVLRERGGLATPLVVLATRDMLVLSVLRTRPPREDF
jgi:fructosamine-3-kinase